MKHVHAWGLATAALVAVANASVHADLVTEVIDISGAVSDGDRTNPGQVSVVTVTGHTNLEVINFQWLLKFEAYPHSWGSEARIRITSPSGTEFTFSGADAGWTDSSGVFTTGGTTSAFNGDMFAGDWTFKFYESVNDSREDIDGIYHAAIFAISAIPAPAALPLLLLGGLACRTRRRSQRLMFNSPAV